MTRLHLHNASKSFGKRAVLNSVSFELTTGMLLGLFGRNGSGKSTLLKILFGSLTADELSLTFDGKKILVSRVIPEQLIGYLPQHSFLPKQIKVRDIIPIYHPSPKIQDAIFYDPHIAKLTSQKVGTLSLGELKYFEILLLSNLPHPFLLLDEPFSMLEPLHKERIKDFLVLLKNAKGILITDHYYHDVLDITTHNIILSDGDSKVIASVKDLENYNYLSEKT